MEIRCQYCMQKASGINYRPREQLQNAPACSKHKSSLYIPYKDQTKSQQILTQSRQSRQNSKQMFFDDVVNFIADQFSQLKKQVLQIQQSIKNVSHVDTYDFRIDCKVTNPYMILKNDKQMMLNTFLNRIKKRFKDQYQGKNLRARSSRLFQNCASTRINTELAEPSQNFKGIHSPQSKYSYGTAISDRIKSDGGSPTNALQKINYFVKQDRIKH